MANKFESVSIILPAINETYSMTETVNTILETCDKADLCEFFIVLCNKTTPESIKTAESIKVMNLGIPVEIYFQKEPFVGMAFREAFFLVKGSHFIVMSSDLETAPNLVSQMIAEEKKNPDGIVTVSRWIKGGSFTGYSPVKLVANYIFEKLIALLFLSKCTDLTYGYRIFPTSLMRSINWEETKHPFFLETALKPIRLGVKINEIPGKWESRTEGESQNGFWENFRYFRTGFRVRFMKKENIWSKEKPNA
ncbi:MAG: glycosyltransferase [Lachnospiraceae bacterium]|nr:glycosyltransferase [Lachnospiraceae bacterium]